MTDCLNPCLSTQVIFTTKNMVKYRTSYNNDTICNFQIRGSYSGVEKHPNFSHFYLFFDQTVDITEYYYPEFSLADFLSTIGGILGLWLGVGVVQIGTVMKTKFLGVKVDHKLKKINKTEYSLLNTALFLFRF